jgi:hypothetical protein
MSTSRRSILVFGLISLIAVFGLLWLVSSVSEFRLNQRQILFEVWHGSVWPTGGIQGFFVDSDGDVYTFNNTAHNPFERMFRDTRREAAPYTTSDLFRYYGKSSQLVGTIDPTTLQEMSSLVQPASVGMLSHDDPLTPETCASRDAGILTYVAFLYDPDAKLHTPIYLYTMGDFPQVNLSEEGRTLHQWLQTTCFQNGYFSGCDPASEFCRP